MPSCWGAVSFLLEDAPWCDWIFREFDGERVPKPLAHKPGRFGAPYPDRLSIAPDPSDSSELEGYTETIPTAQHLILVISPASANSPVLEDHLRRFKAAGGAERVIALVVKGDPASPAAEAGSAEDRAWLPPWLAWRFEENRFRTAATTEPLVIDARLGVSSLAEARAGVMAALLEVDRGALNELGIVTRPTSSLIEFPRSSYVPPATPSNARFLDIATDTPVPRRQTSMSLWVCGFAAMVALGVLALWPTPPARIQLLGPGSGNGRVRSPAIADPSVQLVEARPMLDAPLTVDVPLATEGPVEAPKAPLTAGDAGETPASVEVVATRSPRDAQVTRRDRMTRLAESRMAEGNSDEALEILGHAVDVGREIILQGDAIAIDYLDLAMLHRRTGTLAEGLSQPAVAQKHYESGKQTIFDLRAKETLSREALRLLVDLDSRLKQGSR